MHDNYSCYWFIHHLQSVCMHKPFMLCDWVSFPHWFVPRPINHTEHKCKIKITTTNNNICGHPIMPIDFQQACIDHFRSSQRNLIVRNTQMAAIVSEHSIQCSLTLYHCFLSLGSLSTTKHLLNTVQQPFRQQFELVSYRCVRTSASL